MNGTSRAGARFTYIHRDTWEIKVFYIAPSHVFTSDSGYRALLTGESGCRHSLVVTSLGRPFSSIHADLGQKSGKGKMLRQEDWTLKNLFRFQTVLFLSIKEFSRHIFYVCGYISRCIKIHTSVFNKSVPWSKHLPENILKILGFTFSQTGLFRETKESAWQDYGVASIHFLYSCG